MTRRYKRRRPSIITVIDLTATAAVVIAFLTMAGIGIGALVLSAVKF